jgi:hypothetical protein
MSGQKTKLKEKAKTGVEIWRGVEGAGGQEYAEGKWVRLEDAQKEIDKKLDNYAKQLCKQKFIKELLNERLELKQKLDKLKLWIFGLYKKADHLSHEDERQSCACILRDVFGVETEESMFGELLLTEKSQKELEGLLK